MYKKNKKVRILSILTLFTVLLQIIMPLGEVFAGRTRTNDSILQNVQIIGKQDKYLPGETIDIKADWVLPDDSIEKTYYKGDQFKIVVPEGFKPLGEIIELRERGTGIIYGVGRYDGSNTIVFTFTDEIEGEDGRHGGFNIQLAATEVEGDQDVDLDLILKDEKDREVLNENITVSPGTGIVGPEGNGQLTELGEGFVSKGGYKSRQDEGNMKWWARVNRDGKSKGKVKIVDKLGEDQLLVKGSIKISERFSDGFDYGYDLLEVGGVKYRDITDDAVIVEKDDGFEIDLTIKEYGDHEVEYIDENGNTKTKVAPIRSYFEISYESQYIGDSQESIIVLDNDISAFTKDRTEDKNGTGEYILGGWGTSNRNTWTRFNLDKVDADNNDIKLKNAEFKLENLYNNSIYFLTMDKDGKAHIEDEYGNSTNGQLLGGAYELTETKAPEGYILDEIPRKIFIDAKNNTEFTLQVENTKKAPETVDIEIEKIWKNINKKDENPSIVIELYQDGELIKEVLLEDGRTEYRFKNLPKYTEDENKEKVEIKYDVKERFLDEYQEKNYKKSIESNENKYTLINTKEGVNISLEKEWLGVEEDQIDRYIAKFDLINKNTKEILDSVELRDGKINHVFENLDKYDLNGGEIEYDLVEAEIRDFEVKKNVDGNKFKFTNTLKDAKPINTIDLLVEKEWLEDSQDERPDYIIIDLLKDGVPYMSGKITEKDNWKIEIKNLAKYKLGENNEETEEEIKYEIREVVPEGYKLTNTKESISDDGKKVITLTNSKLKELKTLFIEKQWVDIGGNIFDSDNLPDEYNNLDVKIDLYRSTNKDNLELLKENIVLNNENKWKTQVSDLEIYNEDGKEYSYWILEKTSDDFTLVSINKYKDTDEYIVRNRLNPDKEDIDIEKKWDSKGENLPESIVVDLLLIGKDKEGKLLSEKLVDTITLNDENNWKGVFKDKAIYTSAKEDIVYDYMVREREVDGYSPIYEGSIEEGFTITNIKDEGETPPLPEPEKQEFMDLTIDKIWQDKDGNNILDKINNLSSLDKDLEEVKEDEIVEEVKEDEIAEEVKEDEIAEEIKEDEIAEEIKEDEIAEEIKEDEIAEEVKEDEIAEEVKEDEIAEEIKEDEIAEELKEDEIVEEVKEDEIVEEVKENEIVEEVKEDEIVEEVKEDEIGEEVEKNNFKLPENIEVILYADGVEIDRIKISAEDNWKAIFKDLKKYREDETGNISKEEIEYIIKEVEIEDYKAEYIELDDGSGFKIINKYDPKGELPEEPEEPEIPEEPEEPEIPEEPGTGEEPETGEKPEIGEKPETGVKPEVGEKPHTGLKPIEDGKGSKLPATGSKSNLVIYLLGMSIIGMGVFLKRKNK